MSGNTTPNNHIFDANKNFWTEMAGKTAQNRHFTPSAGEVIRPETASPDLI
jgi:hypothetical protein